MILAAYGMTAFIIAAIYVGTPLMYDAMKDASRFKKPWGKSYLVERTNLIAYHDERSDMRNTIDILIVSNNIFWLACIFQAPFFGYFNKLIFFIILAFISSIITAIFVIIPISKYLLEHRVILHGGKTYSEVTRNDNDTNDKYRMK